MLPARITFKMKLLPIADEAVPVVAVEAMSTF